MTDRGSHSSAEPIDIVFVSVHSSTDSLFTVSVWGLDMRPSREEGITRCGFLQLQCPGTILRLERLTDQHGGIEFLGS